MASQSATPTAGQPDPLVGTRVSSYEVRELIGYGGMGRVYRAQHLDLDRQVAIKVLNQVFHPGQPTDEDRKRRFLREARAASSLNHPNIVTVYDLVRDAGREFLIMEYVEGPSLAAILEEGPLPRQKAYRFARQIAGALAAAHRVGVIHRDTKPSNVVIAGGDVAKLLDFGLAKLVDASGRQASSLALTQDGTVVGTVHYMSPEQALGRAVDHRSDIFSFATLFFEMLTGRRAFDGDSAAAVLHAVAYGSPPDLSECAPPIPNRLVKLLGRALEKEPARRIASMAEMLPLLDELGQSESAGRIAAQDRPSALWRMPGMSRMPWIQKGMPRGMRGAWASGLLVVVGLLVAVIFWLVSLLGGAETPPAGPIVAVPVAETLSEAEAPGEGGAYAAVQTGQRLLRRLDRPGHLDGAIESFHSALAHDDLSSAAHAGLALAQLEKYLIENRDPVWLRRSEANAERAVLLEPGLASAHAIHALVLVRLGRLDEARSASETALVLNPLEVEAHRAEIELAATMGRHDEVIQRLERAVELIPGSWRLRASLAEKLHAAGRNQEAAEVCRAWLELTPDNVYAYQTLGGLLMTLGDLDGASSALQAALEIRPEADVYSNLGTLLYFRGRYGQAAEQYRRAVELKPNQRVFWSNLGDALRQARDGAAAEAYLRAIQLIRDALETAPEDPTLLSELAEAYAKRGEAEQALEILARIEAATEPGPEVWFAAAKSYELAGDRARSIQALEKALGAGYSLSEIQLEPELIELRKDLRYHQLLTRMASAL